MHFPFKDILQHWHTLPQRRINSGGWKEGQKQWWALRLKSTVTFSKEKSKAGPLLLKGCKWVTVLVSLWVSWPQPEVLLPVSSGIIHVARLCSVSLTWAKESTVASLTCPNIDAGCWLDLWPHITSKNSVVEPAVHYVVVGGFWDGKGESC